MIACAPAKAELLEHGDLHEVFAGARGARKVQLCKDQEIRLWGGAARSVFLVESGSIRTVAQSITGTQCLLGLYLAGEIFGELSLLEQEGRCATAIAREASAVWRMSAAELTGELDRRTLWQTFALHLLRRLREDQARIAELVTEPSQRRLGRMLLLVARRRGRRTSAGLRIELRIRQEEWAAMIGTTRPRVSTFLADFKQKRLLFQTRERHLVVDEVRLMQYLGEI